MVRAQTPPLSELLKRYRRAAALTQEELAERAELSVRGIRALEGGQRTRPHKDTIRLLADALQLTGEERSAFEAAARATLRLAATSTTWSPASGGDFLGAHPLGPLVAREEEWNHFLLVIDAVFHGSGRLVLLPGEAGVGKTRLAQEVELETRNRGFLVGTGRCYEEDRTVRFAPFQEVLATLSTHVAPPRWQELLAQSPAAKALLSDERVSAEMPEVEERQLARAVVGLVTALGDTGPLALLLDSLQWADEASLHLVQHLTRTIRAQPLLLLGTYRESELAGEHILGRMVRDLMREGLAERIPVRRLTPEGTGALVKACIGELDGAEEFVEFVHRRSKGTPFLIKRMVLTLGGRYRLVRQIGAGGMGRVFEAVDTESGRTVAAKIMFARTESEVRARLRFEQEGAILATLEHPNIVRVYGTFLEEHASCIVMELLEGQSLDQIIDAEAETDPEGMQSTHKGMPLQRVKQLMLQVLAALACAHDRGIAHRDIKPENIMVLEGDRVKVTDFGIARLLRPSEALTTMTSTGMTMGTPLYMAPEQIRGDKVDGRADLYAVGAVLYQLVTGRPPFEGDDPLSVVAKHLQEAPLPPSTVNPQVPKDWNGIILKALAKDPADRFQSAAALEAAIAELSTDEYLQAPEGDREIPPRAIALAAGSEGEAISRPRRSFLRLLTPRPRPALGKAVAGGKALPVPAERDSATTINLSLLQRVRAALASRPAMIGATAIVLIALTIGSLLRLPHASGTPVNPRLVGIWAAQSTGRFQDPAGVTTDAQGNVYVADDGSNHIQKLSPTGQPIAQWGSPGNGPGQFSGPSGIAVDQQGNIYVADTANNRIEKFASDGTFKAAWGGLGPLTGQLSAPFGMALDRHGNIYVAAAGDSRIQVLSPSGRPLHQWGQFASPVAVCVDRYGYVYVADTPNGQIDKLSPTGKLLLHWHVQGGFGPPAGLAVDGEGNVYVTDQVDDTILKFSSNGAPEGAWGELGSLPGQFVEPKALAVDGRGHLLVADANNQRIQQLSASTGEPLAVWAETGTAQFFLSPAGLAVDGNDSVYVADSTVNGRIYKVNPSGLLDSRWQTGGSAFGFEYKGVSVGPNGTVYATDQINALVVVLSSSGRRRAAWTGPARTPLDAPTGIAFAHGSVYVADAGNDRIVQLSPAGRALRSWGTPGDALGQFTSPAGVAVDPAGNIYVVDSSNDTLQKISPQGKFIAQWGGSGSGNGQFSSPSAVAVDTQGHVYVADTGNNRIEELSSEGSFIRAWGAQGSSPGQFQSPQGIAVDVRGDVYVADTNNHRVQKFALPS